VSWSRYKKDNQEKYIAHAVSVERLSVQTKAGYRIVADHRPQNPGKPIRIWLDQERSPMNAAFRPPTPPRTEYSPVGTIRLTDYIAYFKAMRRNPLEVWGDHHYQLRIAPFRFLGRKSLMINDPEAIHHCFVSNVKNYRMQAIRQAVLRPFLRDGLLTAEGEVWKTARHAVAPIFTPRRINAFAPRILSVVEAATDQLQGRAGQSISLSRLMVDLTLDILIETLFSGDKALDKERFTRNINRLIEITGIPHPLDLIAAPHWVPRIGHGGSRQVIQDLRDQVAAIAAQRRAETGTDDKDQPVDFLDLLLGSGLEEAAIIDNLLTFLAAGHETTARSLSWTLYLLSQSDDVRQRLEDELDGAKLDPDNPADWLNALPWTLAVIKESLRLYPSAPVLTRTSNADDTVGGHAISADTEIIVSTWILHRHPDLWPDPDSFRPERFFGDAEQSIPRDAYLPFGLGPRVCIGARFAMMEMVIVLARLLKRFRFEHVGAHPVPVMKITLQPDTELPMRLVQR
jgi:cytochrome P450